VMSWVKHLEEDVAAVGLELPEGSYEELAAVSHPPVSLRG